jgi:anti-sigma regulatory factor (Ser/Thr protein kinase)
LPIPPPPPSPVSEPVTPVAPLRLCVRRRERIPDHGVEISLRVPTDLEIVEEAVDVVARHCLASGLTPHAARFNLRVALSEALSNAIVYGNQLDPAKRVDVRVEVGNGSFAVHVRDEGAGFDPGSIPDPTLPDRIELPEGRGLFLIRQLMDQVSFNDRGNAICMILRRA